MNLSPAMRALLSPLGVAYASAARLRAWLYAAGLLPRRRLAEPVVSVGNLTTGGTGKTPMVMWLAARLAAQGRRVGILTRGYRSDAGARDEPAALARFAADQRHAGRIRLGIGSNRFAAGRVLEAHGVEMFVLDDGFQHLRLHRDADIVLLDASDPFGEGMLPAGRRREPKVALRRADVVVITRSTHAPAVETVVRRFTVSPVFYAETVLRGVADRSTGARVPPLQFTAVPGFAFCGLGNPRAFFDDLERWGFRLAGRAVFPDHHAYRREELQRLEQQARQAGAAALVATEKDRWNLADAGELALPLWVVSIELRPADPEGLLRAIESAVERNRSVR
jgi:tetraacyldisaccharide 4'-kinase